MSESAYFDEIDTSAADSTDAVDNAGSGAVADQTAETTQEAPKPETPRGDPAIALKAERAARRAERREFERKLQELESRLTQSAPKEQPKVIDPEADPIGALQEMYRRQQEQDQQRQRQEQETAQQAQFRQHVEKLEREVADYEAEFAADHPDYTKATEFLTVSRTQEYQAMGYAPQEIQQALAYEFMAISQRAMQGHQNPAEVFYNLAKQRGFTSTPSPIDKIAAGQKAAATLNNGGGKSGDEVTAEMLLNAEGAEYDKLWAKYAKQQKR